MPLHWLAYLCWPVALAHTFGMGTDAREVWVVALGVVCVAAVAASLAWRVQSSAGGIDPHHPHHGLGHRPSSWSSRAAREGHAVPSASETLTTVGRYRLLGHPRDLAGHVAALGSVPLPAGRKLSWRQDFAAALEASGLAGRGGANFPAAIKLAVAHAGGRGGSIVVNAMEGEPASDKDKLLLLRSPHLVLDGAQLLAAACEAARVTVCIPAGRDHVGRGRERSHGRARRSRMLTRSRDSGPAARPLRRRGGVRARRLGPIEERPCRRSARTRAFRCASGVAASWSTTQRPWPTWP